MNLHHELIPQYKPCSLFLIFFCWMRQRETWGGGEGRGLLRVIPKKKKILSIFTQKKNKEKWKQHTTHTHTHSLSLFVPIRDAFNFKKNSGTTRTAHTTLSCHSFLGDRDTAAKGYWVFFFERVLYFIYFFWSFSFSLVGKCHSKNKKNFFLGGGEGRRG